MHEECSAVQLLRMDDLRWVFLSEHSVRKMDHKKNLSQVCQSPEVVSQGPITKWMKLGNSSKGAYCAAQHGTAPM